MFTDAADLIDAVEGNQGPEAQQEALDFAEETGLLDAWQQQEAGGADDQYRQDLAAELARVERSVGRALTAGEERAMIDTISTQDFTEQVVPDFTAEFGDELASARNHESGRLHLGAERAQAVMDQQAPDNGIPQPAFEPPEPANGDYGAGEEE